MHEKAVYVKDVVKFYGNNKILDGLCMTVERGSIYGLLGASGCGKTTLLSCIVGRKSINSGEIWCLGGQPGEKGGGVPGPRVGYMPQEIALVGEFTVKDAVFYFGRIFSMKDSVISERFESLSELLELPPEDRYIKNCSGGQQRRVSFAAAMIHKPELLILDEPTVGVDPVLRDRIWNYLVDIVAEENIAVIITTHYIDECKQANKIGLMRGGKLLAEESPSRLLQLFGTDNLEDAFLILSKKQEEGRLEEVIDRMKRENGVLESASSTTSVATFEIGYGSKDELTPERKKTKQKLRASKTGMNRNRLKALMDKNWKQFYRNVTGVLFLITFPIIQVLCFLYGVGGDITGLKLGIINEETNHTMCPENFSFNGTAVPFVTEEEFSDCNMTMLSCRFLTYLDHPMIIKKYYDSLPVATAAIKHGDIIGVIYMKNNFSDSYEQRIRDGKETDSWFTDYGEIKVYMDMSNRQTGATLKYKLYDLFFDFNEQLLSECGYPKRLGSLPIQKHFVHGHDTDPYYVYMTPGTLITMVYFLGAMMTSQIIITDRKEGVWDRSIVAGVTSLEITLTHFILQAGVMVVQVVELIIVVFGIYKIQNIGGLWLVALIMYIEGICGMAYGFWVSVICEDHSAANIVVTGGFLPMMLLCGLIWPTEAMVAPLRIFAKCLPFTLSIESLRNVVKKGWPIQDPQVAHGIGVGVFWILFLGIISVFLVKKKF